MPFGLGSPFGGRSSGPSPLSSRNVGIIGGSRAAAPPPAPRPAPAPAPPPPPAAPPAPVAAPSLAPTPISTQSGAGYRPPSFGGQPYGPGGEGLGEALKQNYETGAGLQDPDSDYYKRLMEAMRGQLGSQAAAAQRAQALRASQSGLGGGASPELLAQQQRIGQTGLQAAGQAGANLALQAPMAGANIVQGTYGPALGMQQLTQQGYQFGQDMAFQQQQAANQQAQFQAQLQQQANLANQRQQMQQYLAMLNASLGGF